MRSWSAVACHRFGCAEQAAHSRRAYSQASVSWRGQSGSKLSLTRDQCITHSSHVLISLRKMGGISRSEMSTFFVPGVVGVAAQLATALARVWRSAIEPKTVPLAYVPSSCLTPDCLTVGPFYRVRGQTGSPCAVEGYARKVIQRAYSIGSHSDRLKCGSVQCILPEPKRWQATALQDAGVSPTGLRGHARWTIIGDTWPGADPDDDNVKLAHY